MKYKMKFDYHEGNCFICGKEAVIFSNTAKYDNYDVTIWACVDCGCGLNCSNDVKEAIEKKLGLEIIVPHMDNGGCRRVLG